MTKRGRPALPEDERRRRAAVRDLVKRDRRRAAMMLGTLIMTPTQQARLDRLMRRAARPTAGDLVTALTRG